MSDTFEYRKVFHSSLINETPLVMRFTSDPRGADDLSWDPGSSDSGYPYKVVFFEIRGEKREEDYYYIIENEKVYRAIKDAPQNVWVELEGGYSDGEPYISANKLSSDNSSDDYASFDRGSIVENYRACLEAARDLPGSEEDVDLWQDHATTLFIQWARDNYLTPLTESDREAMGSDTEDGEEASGPSPSPQDYEEMERLMLQIDSWEGESHDEKSRAKVLDRLERIVENGASQDAVDGALQWLERELEFQEEEAVGVGDDLPF